jgi:hypothetical protein
LSEVKEVRLRLTKAIDDQVTVKKYIKGHEDVLLHNGVKLSEGYDYWKSLESVYLLVAESIDGELCYGGARLHIWNGIEPLPLQTFLSPIEPLVFEKIDDFAKSSGGVVEIAGLWNSRLVAGLGLGSEHIIRTSIAVTSYLEPKSVFTFCSPFVSRFADEFGFSPFSSLGVNGRFPFPDERWMSTINYLPDKEDLSKAKVEESVKISNIRKQRKFISEFNDRGRNLIIHFDL